MVFDRARELCWNIRPQLIEHLVQDYLDLEPYYLDLGSDYDGL